jgi:L-threonylcarbamoyladenylate synthase
LLTAADVAAFDDCVGAGGVVVFPTDTLYGIGCRAGDDAALARVYALKGRSPEKPSAVMWFSLDLALSALAEAGPRTRAALERLLPGPVLAVLPGGTGVRVPLLEGALAPLARSRAAVVQTSANLTGEPAPRLLEEVPRQLREGADLVVDGGELPGVPSTVVDLSRYEAEGTWEILRAGAMESTALAEALRT